MKSLVIAAVFAAAALTNVASADPLICHEPWYTPQPHAPHPMPCHTRQTDEPSQVHASNGHGKGQPPGAHSEAAPDPLTDGGCALGAASDQNPEAPEDTMVGYVYGGPIAQNGTLACTIKVGVSTHSSAYVNGASTSATGTSGVTTLAPTIISYIGVSGVPVYVCDRFTDSANVTYYWDGDANVWTTNSAANCELAITGGTEDPALDPFFDLLDTLDALTISVGKDVLDPLFCPVLSSLAGDYVTTSINSQGDVFNLGVPFWDCPPYDLS